MIFIELCFYSPVKYTALNSKSEMCGPVLLIGNFDIEPKSTNRKPFSNKYKLKPWNRELLCFKNFDNLSFSDLVTFVDLIR